MTMTMYSAVLFVHVASAIAVFIVLAAEGAILFRLRSTQSIEEARFFVGAFHRLRIIAIPAFLGVLVGGLYLGSKFGAGTFWIPSALAATLLIMLIGGLVTGRRTARLRKALSSDETDMSIETISAEISAKTKDNVLLISYGLRIGLAIGIVFLMTAKPELALSIVALGGGVLAGLVVARAMRRLTDRINADRTNKGREPWNWATPPTTQRS
jgi:hypothetical protein